MNQLLIVDSAKALTAKKDAGGSYATPYDLSNLAEGAITFFELGAGSVLSGPATKNFAIALGRSGAKPAFVIPEVDIDTLEIVHGWPFKGESFSATFTMPTTTVGTEYTVILVKKGTVPHERNIFTTSIVAKTTNASDTYAEAVAFRKAINDKTSDLFPFEATGSTNSVVITCKNAGEDYEIKLVDGLSGVSTSSLTHGRKAVGDKTFIEELAKKCAAGKGFNYLDQESLDIYPGYPEYIEGGWTMNTSGTSAYLPGSVGNSTTGYKIYSLHFATGRKAGKQVDERVWQYVYIALPLTKSDGSTKSAALDDLDAILPEGKFSPAAAIKGAVDGAAATTTTPGTGFLTKEVADTLYDPL